MCVRPAGLGRQRDVAREPGCLDQLTVASGVSLSRRSPRREVWRLHPENGSLEGIDPEVAAHHPVVVLALGTMRAQQPHARGEGVVVGGHEPGIPECAQVLAREKRKTSERADPTRRAASVPGTDSLCGILDDGDPCLCCELDDRVHVSRLAEQVHGHQRARARRDGAGDLRHVDVEGGRIDVHEHWRRPDPRHGAGGGEERVRAGRRPHPPGPLRGPSGRPATRQCRS